ncbi:hypothetical protein [Halomonas alkaliantarctica]|uniref:hypothetical protein n=1 Tax=Halomonas alkaliantarctica TaxID=232346 RepID=UPI0004AA728B|nr:hypothetical protein [Halomonas alkaliantarctica]
MSFYRRKIFIIPLIVGVVFFAWQLYIYGVMTYQPDPKLTKSAENIFDFIDKNDILKIIIENGNAEAYIRDGRFRAKPTILENQIPSSAIKSIEDSTLNIKNASFTKVCGHFQDCYFEAFFRIKRPFEVSGFPLYAPWWYLRYSPSGAYFEEGVIPSLVDALENTEEASPLKNGYLFCETTELAHWYLCTGKHL